MKILVCISKAPDTTSKIAFTNNNSAFDENGVQYIVNPYDEFSEEKFCSEYHAEKSFSEGYDICQICEREDIRKNLNQYGEAFICDSCEEIKDTYEYIEIEKINENLFVGYSLEDQQIIRTILGKTLMNSDEAKFIKFGLESLNIEVNIFTDNNRK